MTICFVRVLQVHIESNSKVCNICDCEESKILCLPGLELSVEELEYKTEDGPQGWVPLMLVKPERIEDIRGLPTAILLHPTGCLDLGSAKHPSACTSCLNVPVVHCPGLVSSCPELAFQSSSFYYTVA